MWLYVHRERERKEEMHTNTDKMQIHITRKRGEREIELHVTRKT